MGVRRAQRELEREFAGQVEALDRGHYIELTGALAAWEDLVRAGALAARHRGRAGIVNHIRFTGGRPTPMTAPSLRDEALENEHPDVLVIGGGITGSAIARELARYDISILLVDKEHDLALHASSRNDGMVHPGIDLRKGSLKHRYNLAGNKLYDTLCEELGVPFVRSGQYLCFKGSWLPLLYLTLPYWRWLGLRGVKVLGRRALHEAEPSLDENLGAALFFPSAGSVCPYSLTIALAENAVQNGAQVSLDTAVEAMEVKNGKIVSVATNRGRVYPKIVVNAAGVFADEVAAMAGDQFYSIHPRRGTNAILDAKYSDNIAKTIVSSIGTSSTKTAHSKGGGIVRTAEGNILVGPDAVETCEKEDFATHREGVQATFEKQVRTVPALSTGKIITYFTGVRAPTYEEDFVVQRGVETENLIHAAGIQSPGITAVPAIGIEVARLAAKLLGAARKGDFDPVRPPIVKAAALPLAQREALIKNDADYGLILCRCEEVSRGEVLAALRRPIPCDTVDGVKRRVRPGMGRCQGGFCGPLVAGLIAEETGKSLHEVLKSGEGSAILCGPVKGVTP